MKFKNQAILISIVIGSVSCESDKTNKTSYYCAIESLSHNIQLTEFCESVKSQSIVINIDKHQVQMLNLSTYSVGKIIQDLMFGSDSLSYQDVLDTNLIVRNNKGKLISVPFRSIIKQP